MPGNCEIFNKLLEDDLAGGGGTPNTDKLIELKTNSGYTDSDIWYPAFIDQNSSSIGSSVMTAHGVINTQRLGIAGFISFSPSFKSWTTNGVMSIDWILNNHRIPYPVYYGMMFWFKIMDDGFLDGANLWIPDGDAFAFERSTDDSEFYSSNSVTHRTYVGTGLYKYYREIHNALTLQETKTRSKSVKRSRMHKAIAAYLSTSPFVGEFYINAMNSDTVRGYVNTAIDSAGSLSDIQTCLVDISTHFNNIGLNKKENDQTLTHNYITSNGDLYTKCKNKYGANLILSDGQYLEYSKALPNGANIECYELRDNLVPSSVSNSKIFINETIDTGYMKVKSQLSKTDTSLLFYGGDAGNSVEIPLAELAKPNLSSVNFLINMVSNTADIYESISSQIPSSDYLFYVPSVGNTPVGFNDESTNQATMVLSPFESEPANFSRQEKVDYNISKLMQFKWEIVSGCANFAGEYEQRNSGFSNKGSVSYDAFPRVRFNSLGPIFINVYVTTPFGTFTKTKTIYVVSAGQAILDSYIGSGGSRNSSLPIGTYLNDQGVQITPSKPSQYEFNPLPASSNGNMVVACNMVRYAFSDQGVFWPIDTDFYVSPSQYSTSGQSVQPLKNNYKFHIPNTNQSAQSKYRITFNTTAGAFVKISQMILNCARSSLNSYKDADDNDIQISDCLSVCRVRMTGLRNGRFHYSDISTGGYIFNKITGELGSSFEIDNNNESIGAGVPTTSTAPKINAYGGYSASKRDSIGAPSLPDHPTTGPVGPNVKQFEILNKVDDPSTTEDKEAYKICYQKPVSYGGSIDFHKGMFDPTVGWLSGNTSNKSAVLKFRPGCRETISFIGPGLSQFECDYTDDRLHIRPRTYVASIQMKIAEEIRPEPYCPGCQPSQSEEEQSGWNRFDHERRQNIIKRACDQFTHRESHGYRILGQGRYKRSEEDSGSPQVNFFQCDEFGFETGGSISSSDCSANSASIEKVFLYKFWKLGAEDTRLETIPYIYELNDFQSYKSFVEDTGSRPDPNIYDTRYINASIDDMEVKLNLFNILNTKDYAFKITVNYDNATAKTWEASSAGGTDPRPSAPVSKMIQRFIEGTDASLKAYNMYGSGKAAFFKGADNKNNLKLDYAGLDEYCGALVDTNSQKSYTYKTLYLMNQEHFCSNSFNTTLVFSDHANKNNVLYNHNRYNPNGVIIHQNIVKSTDQKMLPSLAADGYSEADHIFYRNLMMNNNISIGNSTFSKFHNLGFFKKVYDTECCTKYDDDIKFSLEIEVLDEPDLMGAYETTRDGPALAGFYKVNNIPTSDSPFNSICNWELILHTSPTPKMAPHTTSSIQSMNNSDAFGLIEYGRSPRYGGYNFIADMSGRKHLLPTVNMDAPNTYMSDLSVCNSGTDSQNFSRQIYNPMDFPYGEFLRILTTFIGVAYLGSLVGALTFLGYTGFDFSAIIDYLGSLTGQRNKDDSERNIYAMDFSKYYPGSPEKVLLNVSKDGGIWYKLEASIFKLSNTPALFNNSYDFALMKKDVLPLFTNIKFETVNSIKQLIDEGFIKDIIVTTTAGSSGSSIDINSAVQNPGAGTYNDIEVETDDIVYIRSHSHSEYNGIYIVNDDSFSLLEPDDISNIDNYVLSIDSIYNSIPYIASNSVFSASRSGFFGSFRSNADDGKIIIVDNEYCFNMFDVGDTVELYSGNRSKVFTINNKAKIIKDNIIKTALLLNDNASSYAYLSPYFEADESSGAATPSGTYKAIVFKANTTVEHDRSVPFNRWSMEKSGIPDTVPNVEKSMISTGSVGDGSLNVDKGIFTNTLRYNKIHNLYDIFNNHESMRVKYNSMTFIFSDETTNYSNGSSTGYRVSYDDFRQTFSNNITFNEAIEEEDRYNILERINIADPNKQNYSIMIICFNPGGGSMAEDTGKVIIDQDFQYKVVKTISDSDKTLIEDRIETLESSIFGLESLVLSLSTDPAECHFPNPTIDCPKNNAEKSLYAMYHERAKLLEVLDSVSDNTDVLGSVEIVVNENSDGSLTTEEKVIGDDNYWINIDTEQFCSVADEMTPKVLVKTKVECIPIIQINNAPIPADHNICPAFAQGDASSEGGYTESYNGRTTYFEYIFDADAVEAEKQSIQSNYSSIAGWKSSGRTRIMYAFGESLDTRTNNVSCVLRITEEYQIAVPVEDTININWQTNPALYNDHTIDIDSAALSSSSGTPLGYIGNEGRPGKVINIFNLDNTNTLKVNFRRIPRSIRGRDRSGQVQRIDQYGNRYASPEASVGFAGNVDSGSLIPEDIDIADGKYLINDMYAWYCFRKDKSGILKPETVPDYFKLLNEMEFRAFFGSEDGVENKNINVVETLNPEEMIPYEFGGPDDEA